MHKTQLPWIAAALMGLALGCGGVGAPTPADDIAPANAARPGWLGVATSRGVVVPWPAPFEGATAGATFALSGEDDVAEIVFAGVTSDVAVCGEARGAQFAGVLPAEGAVWLAPPGTRVTRTLLTPSGEPSTSWLKWTWGDDFFVRLNVEESGRGRLGVQQIELIGMAEFTAEGADLRDPTGVPIPESFLEIGETHYLTTRIDSGGTRTYQLRNLDASLSVAFEATLDGC